MKETLQIPTPETLEALIGKELYDIWTSLCQLIEQKVQYGTTMEPWRKKMDIRI